VTADEKLKRMKDELAYMKEQQQAEEQPFDIVISTLQAAADGLMNITKANMDIGMFTVMDQIRLEQVSQLEEAIKLWQKNTSV